MQCLYGDCSHCHEGVSGDYSVSTFIVTVPVIIHVGVTVCVCVLE